MQIDLEIKAYRKLRLRKKPYRIMIKRYRKTMASFLILLVCLIIYFVLIKNTLDRPINVVEKNEIEKRIDSPIKQVKLFVQERRYSTPKYPDILNFASSIEGTEIDGALTTDANGNLELNISARDFFDYFLGASDEVGVEVVIDEIVRYANEYLPEPANEQAIELLKNYLRYKKAEIELQQIPISQKQLTQENTIDLLLENFSALKDRRKALFTDEVDQAFFFIRRQLCSIYFNELTIEE